MLVGAEAAVRERLGALLPLAMRTDHERTLIMLRHRLGDDEFRAARAAPAARSPDETVALALADQGSV